MPSLSSLIAPHFHNDFNSKKVHQIFEGGRGSTKTSRNALRVAERFVADDNCNIVVIRRHKNTLRQSVYAEIKKALGRLGLTDGIHYKCYVSPMKIVNLINGNTIYFGGLDDSDKLKGMVADESKITPETLTESLDYDDVVENVEKDSIKIVWLSEITEIKEEEDILQTVATFSRGLKDYFFVLYEYNPPKNKYHWVNEWCEEMKSRPDVLHSHSDYTTVPADWLGPIFIQQAEELKKNDPQRYDHIYLALVTGLEGLIYNSDLINVIDNLDGDEFVIFMDIFADTGHMVSASTYLCVGLTNKGRIVLLDTYYYSPNGNAVKKAPSELSNDLWDFTQFCCKEWRARQDTMVIDSAEGALRNQFFKDYGIWLAPVNKSDKEVMIDNVETLLATGRFCVLNRPNNAIFLLEHRTYEWLEGSVEARKPVPDKRERQLKMPYFNTHSKCTPKFYAEHTCDALQYGVIMNLRKYNLKL